MHVLMQLPEAGLKAAHMFSLHFNCLANGRETMCDMQSGTLADTHPTPSRMQANGGKLHGSDDERRNHAKAAVSNVPNLLRAAYVQGDCAVHGKQVGYGRRP